MRVETNLKACVLMSIFLLGKGCTAAVGGTIYVDANAAPGGDGTTWSTAYKYLQDALYKPPISEDEIWVATGTYKPDQDEAGNVIVGDSDACFELKSSVIMYGGFPTGGGAWEARNPNLSPTILSGDLNGDDEPDFVNYAENSKTITRIGWREGLTTLDGFIIKASYDYGLYNFSGGGGQIVIANCKFLQHRSYALFLRHPDHTGTEKYVGTLLGSEIINCIFQNNGNGSTAVVSINGFSPIFQNCIFKDNTAWPLSCRGFHMWPENQVYSNPTFINSEFIGNAAGAVYIAGECTSTFVNCIIAANRYAGISQGGMSGGGLTTLINCTITNNTAGIDSGRSLQPPIVMYNSIVWGNGGGSAYSQINYGATIYSSTIQDGNEDGTYVYSGAVNPNITTYDCIDWNPNFVREPDDGGDGWGVGDNDVLGDVHLSFNSPCIDAGDNNAIPVDSMDIDGDGNTTEPFPWDMDSHTRFVDGDCNGTDIVDMGAYEFGRAYIGDLDCDGDVDFGDFAIFAVSWMNDDGDNGSYLKTQGHASNDGCSNYADIDRDGKVNYNDLALFMQHWLEGTPWPPSNPDPANNATGVDPNAVLRWTGGLSATSHDVYFGTSSPPPFKSHQTDTIFDPGTMAHSSTYYWRIDAINASGKTTGTVWSFQTIYLIAKNPNPLNSATGVSTTADLSWTAGAGATSHDVHFGTNSPPPFIGNQTDTIFDPNTMSPNTTYYWRIDEVSLRGTTIGDVWSFTTAPLPGQASNPNPPDNSMYDSYAAPDLSWTAGSHATSHDVYFGNINPPPFICNQTETAFDPGIMSPNTTYYWRIDELNQSGKTTGLAWSFMAMSPCIALWKFDDGSGSLALDSVGSNNGTLYGDATWTIGRIGGALSFDGADDYVVAAPVAPLASNTFSAQAWIRIDESVGLIIPFMTQNRLSDSDGFYIYIYNHKPCVYIYGSSGSANANSTETLNANQWYHVAATNDGANLKVYVDGRLKDSDSSTGLTGVNENAYIGYDPITSTYYMGLIDDVRIYDEALSEDEIAILAK